MTTEVTENDIRNFINSDSSQDVESTNKSLKSTEDTDSDDSNNEDEIEMSSNQEDNMSTIITTSTKHPTSLITVSTSDDAVYEFIHWDYFVDKKTQLDNKFWRNKDTKQWDSLKKKVENAIDDCLKDRMIAEAQNQNITVRLGNNMKEICRWKDIGKSYKQHSSPEIARRFNIICRTQFDDDVHEIEKKIMDICLIKYTSEKDVRTTISCVKRLITKRMCYLVC